MIKTNVFNNEFILILGPMWSYKTTTLLHLIRKKQQQNKKCIIFAPEATQRSDRPFLEKSINIKWIQNTQENLQKNPTLPQVASVEDLKVKLKNQELNKDTWVFIDELHFFQPEIENVIKEILKICNVAAAGLAVNYATTLFETPQLVSKYATRIIFKQANCWYCENSTDYYEKIPGSSQKIDGTGVGGTDKYLPACYACMHIESQKLSW